MTFCIDCGSDKIEANGRCASCAHALRKAERQASRIKVVTPIRKVSFNREKELLIYARKTKNFLLGKWCGIHGHPCIPTQVHHQKGRQGYCDEWARENNVTALLDVRFWLPVCDEGHKEITEHSAEAIEKGYSLKRTI